MINNFKKGLGIFLLISFFVFLPVLSLAGDGDVNFTPSGKIVNPINASSLEGLIQMILIGVLKIGIPIIALAIIYCGFLFVSARGNSEAIGKAKDALLYTVIGAAILLGAWAIALLISNTVLAL